MFWTEIIPEAVRIRFQHRERLNVGVFLDGVIATGLERNHDVVSRILGGPFDTSAAAQHDEIG
jgi:hypothetical protein